MPGIRHSKEFLRIRRSVRQTLAQRQREVIQMLLANPMARSTYLQSFGRKTPGAPCIPGLVAQYDDARPRAALSGQTNSVQIRVALDGTLWMQRRCKPVLVGPTSDKPVSSTQARGEGKAEARTSRSKTGMSWLQDPGLLRSRVSKIRRVRSSKSKGSGLDVMHF